MKKKALTFLVLCACMSLHAQNGEQGGETHEYVDLGLPSGTLWATCNVGANSPEEYGDYFAWGETEPKDTYDWSNYKWCNGSREKMTKYCPYSGYDMFDNKKELDPEDDAATINWGIDWCIPTLDQIKELLYNPPYITTEWTTQNDVYGWKITSKKNGKSIFLPAAGYRDDSSIYQSGSKGYYWSSLILSDGTGTAYSLCLNSEKLVWILKNRNSGQPVRPVRRDKNTSTTYIDGISVTKDEIKDGKYISNGNLVLVKDGRQYNANGMRK